MAGITSAGVGSGLPLEDIINATLNAEDQPKLKKFEQTKTRLNVELSALGAIKSSMSALNDIVKKLGDMNNFNKRSATIRQPTTGDLISVTPNAKSTVGSFNVEVTKLAQGSRATTSGLFTSPTEVVTTNTGKLTISAGSKSFDIDVAAGATLEDIRQAINGSKNNFGISVNIINTGGIPSEAKLVVTSNVTGAGNDLKITNDNNELDRLSTHVGVDPTGGLQIAPADVAADANMLVDGVLISSPTNKFTNAVQDLTITALKVGALGEKAKIDVSQDSAGVEKLIDEFIKAYNNSVGTIDYHTKVGAGLYGDSTMRSLKEQLTSGLSTVVADVGKFETIFDIGIALKKDGTLEKSTLVRSVSTSLSESFVDVGAVFASEGGFGKTMQKLLDINLDAKGAFKYRQDNIGVSLKDLEEERKKHDYRMEQLEARLRAQYAGLDSLIARMQSSGSYLQTQLNNLPGFTRKS